MRKFYIGVDTGGTYTDAAIIELPAGRVVSSAKSLTTKGNLSTGVYEALRLALDRAGGALIAAEAAVVSLSTTLATNAVVEGHGSRVAVVLAGFDDRMVERTGIAKAFPDVPIIRIAGGHDHNGDEVAKLDLGALRTEVARVSAGVSAFALASAFAVRNSAHETAMESLVRDVCGKPSTLSSQLTSSLDAPRRALTATLNARLISRVTGLVASVTSAMGELGINCPLMIVKGDGSLAKAKDVALRPIETVLSGPAASVIGAKWLSGLDDFILSDIGGTTTDVAVLQNGMPRVATDGASVGGWRTMVRAIDVVTTGLGGDSEVHIGLDGSLKLGPQRVVPLSLLAARYPHVLEVLAAETQDSETGSYSGRFVLLPFESASATADQGLPAREQEILSQIKREPIAIRKIAPTSLAQRALAALVKKGLAQISAFSPSDAAHVLNLQDNWSRDGALFGAQLAARNRDMRAASDESVTAFCRDVWDAVVAQSAHCILDAALPPGLASGHIIDAVCHGKPQLGLVKAALQPQVPIIAVGGPASVFYPEVGRRLDCEVHMVEQASVANAVGAAAGLVAHRAEVRIEGDGSGLFRLFDGRSTRILQSGIAALVEAEAAARARVTEMAGYFGVSNPAITLTTEKTHLPDALNDDGLLTALVVAEAATAPV